MLLDQRSRRNDANDIAANQLIRARLFHLLGERDDETLIDEPPQIGIECVVGHAGHGDARSAAGILAGQRNL